MSSKGGFKRTVYTCAVALALVGAAYGQGKDLEERAMGPKLQQLIAAQELQRERGKGNCRVFWDPATGCPRNVMLHRRPLRLRAKTSREAAREVMQRLAPLYGSKQAPSLEIVEVVTNASGGRVVLEQRVGTVPLEGARVQVLLQRKKQVVYAEGVLGRIFRDPPLAFDTIPLPKGGPLKIGQITLTGTEPKIVGTPRGGRWQPAVQTIERAKGGLPMRVLRDAKGKVLARVPYGCTGGVRARVFRTDPSRKPTTVPVRDLYVRTRTGRSLTDASGQFKGRYGSLPGGLEGPFERVVHHGHSYPRTSRGVLELSYRGEDPRLDEVNVFHHLVETRRWLGQYSRVRNVAAALKKTTVAQVGTTDNNAFALKTKTSVGSRSYDHALFFGNIVNLTSREASVVTHERMHSLQHALGVESGAEIQEGLADYFAAARQGSPRVGSYALGVAARDVSEHRTWPQDEEYDNHITGLILAGALWDARRELGDSVGGYVLAALPATRMTELAQKVVSTAPKGPAKVLKKHFVRHGLLEDEEENHPPEIRIRSDGLVSQQFFGELTAYYARVKASDPAWKDASMLFEAWDPEGRRVELSVTGLERVKSLELMVKNGSPARGKMRFLTAPKVGAHAMTITAQDDAGNTSFRTFTLYVWDDAVERPTVKKTARIEARVGVRERTSLVDLVAHGPKSSKTLARQGQYRLSGQRVGRATIVDGELVIEPKPGEEGVHTLSIMVRHRDMATESEVVVTIVVGSDTPWIAVSRELPTNPLQKTTPTKLEIAPGRPVTVTANRTTELGLRGYASLPGEPVSEEAVTLSLEDVPETVELVLVPEEWVEVEIEDMEDISEEEDKDEDDSELGLGYGAKLYVQPTGERTVREVTVTLVATAGKRVGKRKLTLIVVPSRKSGHAPVIDAPATVRLKDGSASFEATPRDPDEEDGGFPRLEVLSPSMDDRAKLQPRKSLASSTRTVEVEGERSFTVVLRATDDDGDFTVKEVRVLAPGDTGTAKQTPPRRGAIKALEEEVK